MSCNIKEEISLTYKLDTGQLWEGSIVAIVTLAALHSILAPSVPLGVFRIGLSSAEEGNLIHRSCAASGNTFLSVCVSDTRLPALKKIKNVIRASLAQSFPCSVCVSLEIHKSSIHFDVKQSDS